MLKFLVRLLVVSGIFTVIFLGVLINQTYQFFLRSPSSYGDVIKIVIDEESTSFSVVAHELAETGVIRSAFWFRIAAELAGLTDNIQLGTFEFKPGSNYLSVLNELTAKQQSAEVSVTIPEGYTLSQIGKVFETELGITSEAWLEATGVDSPFEGHQFVIDAEKPDDVDLEGYLFPDTYRFFKDASAEDVVRKMLDTMAARFAEVCTEPCVASQTENLGLDPRSTIHDVLTLASIIEREVRGADDMKIVSDIFISRWKIGMPLQADSTVNYITGGKDPSISFKDRDIESPYNTYQNAGLPPGPIASPGKNALIAALYPVATKYLYFLTDEAGKVYFSATLAEHNRYKAEHLR